MGVGVAEGGCEACETVRVVVRWVEVLREPTQKEAPTPHENENRGIKHGTPPS